ncbi:MAG: hypothetical protein IJ592_04170 [Candidatus Methanomethylophilaceae archaeon]|nr:hypothetical protein [Candidatus Methanomethylophilaceae archaeon]
MDNTEKGQYCLAIFRILVGCIMIWPFFDKLLGLGFKTPAGSGMIDGVSPSSFVVYVTGGIFKDFYDSLAGNQVVDIILMFGLLVLGTTLILGIASKLTTIGITAFMLIMYSLHIPPEDNPVIDHRIIIIAGMISAYFLGGYDKLSLNSRWKETWLVKRFPILR